MWAPLWSPEDGTFSPSEARNAAYTAVGGTPGVASPRALEVRELGVPGSSVRVAPGTVAIPNRTAGAQDEVYVARLLTEETLPIAATGAAARSDLIVARIEDPANTAGPTYPAPADPDAPPVYLRVISDVPAGTVTADGLSADRSEYALARIDLPAHTTTVSANRITDLRALTRAAHATARAVRVLTEFDTVTLAADGQLAYFPVEGLTQLDVPAWATHARAVVTLNGVRFGAAGDNAGAGWSATGDLRIEWGWDGDATNSATVPYALTTPTGVGAHTLTVACDAQPVPLAARGKAATLSVQARRDAPAVAATLTAAATTVATVDVEFYADVESAG